MKFNRSTIVLECSERAYWSPQKRGLLNYQEYTRQSTKHAKISLRDIAKCGYRLTTSFKILSRKFNTN